MATATQERPRKIAPAHGSARLELVITGTRYAARILPTDPASGVYRLVQLRKEDGTSYHAHHDASGIGCDCADFTFNRDGRDPEGCKHTKALRAVGLL